MQACRQVGRQYLTDQLTLSQPDGQIMPTTVLPAPRIFRPCDGPEWYENLMKIQMHWNNNRPE